MHGQSALADVMDGWEGTGLIRRPSRLLMLAVLIVFVLLSGWVLHQEIGRTFTDDPTVWEPEIEARDRPED